MLTAMPYRVHSSMIYSWGVIAAMSSTSSGRGGASRYSRDLRVVQLDLANKQQRRWEGSHEVVSTLWGVVGRVKAGLGRHSIKCGHPLSLKRTKVPKGEQRLSAAGFMEGGIWNGFIENKGSGSIDVHRPPPRSPACQYIFSTLYASGPHAATMALNLSLHDVILHGSAAPALVEAPCIA
jgi:hypothetical protein